MKQTIIYEIEKAKGALQQLEKSESLDFIERFVACIVLAYEKGNKVMIAGNGGSLCDAMHFAEELTGFFRAPRKALAAIALSDPSHLTCVANDVSFEHVFSRSIEALGSAGDIFIALSTSGNSKNLVQAARIAKAKHIRVFGLLGKTGGELKDVCDDSFVVHGFPFSDRIQEVHMVMLHIVVQMVEEALGLCKYTKQSV